MFARLGFNAHGRMETLVKEVEMGCVLVIIAIGCAFTGHWIVALGIVAFLLFIGYK